MQVGNHLSRAENVIPLFTSVTTEATLAREIAIGTWSGSSSSTDTGRIQRGLNNGLGQGHESAWFWEDATLALLGSAGMGAIAIAFRILV